MLLVGCGQVGTELGHQLSAAGTHVHALRRNPAGLPRDFFPLAVDLTQPVTGTLPNVEAMVVTLTPTIRTPDGEDGYLVALEHLAQALPQMPERVILVSSTRVFEGQTDTRALTEEDDVAPVSARGELLVAAEALATELFAAHIVRPAGIYGPGRELLIRKVLNQEPVQYARRTNRIHQTDLVAALDTMLRHESAPKLLHAIDETPGVALGDVVTYLAARLKVTPPPVEIPFEASGRILSGARRKTLVNTLTYPTYREGYDELITARGTA